MYSERPKYHGIATLVIASASEAISRDCHVAPLLAMTLFSVVHYNIRHPRPPRLSEFRLAMAGRQYLGSSIRIYTNLLPSPGCVKIVKDDSGDEYSGDETCHNANT